MQMEKLPYVVICLDKYFIRIFQVSTVIKQEKKLNELKLIQFETIFK